MAAGDQAEASGSARWLRTRRLLSAVFGGAVNDLGPLAQAARLDPVRLAGRVFQALCADQYSRCDELVPVLAEPLGQSGMSALRDSMAAWQAEPIETPPQTERRVVGWASSGEIYADQMQSSHRRHTSGYVPRQIADALGDVDLYIGQFDTRAREAPAIAAAIAGRLLAAGRAQEAWDALESVVPGRRGVAPEWQAARVVTLEALGRPEAAQAMRWRGFLASLNAVRLRAYRKHLPDFEDFEAEQNALAHALSHGDIHQALAFLIAWPDLARAGQLVTARPAQLNGDCHELLTSSAQSFEKKHPLAATLLRRAMISCTLDQARTARYKHAARHLAICAGMAGRIPEFATHPDHASFERALGAAHGRKTGFWQPVGQ